MKTGRTAPRFGWQKRREWMPQDSPWPPPGAALTLVFGAPAGFNPTRVEVHYEIYDGLPLIAKWLTLRNESSTEISLNSTVVEQFAVVETESIVDGSAAQSSKPGDIIAAKMAMMAITTSNSISVNPRRHSAAALWP